MNEDPRLEQAARNTHILRYPYQTLDTFGVTNIEYFILTHPVYEEPGDFREIVIRTGKVIASKPQIITPYYMAKAEGFSEEAVRYFSSVGQVMPGILYTYKNEPGELSIVEGPLSQVAARIARELDDDSRNLGAIISGDDELWDVSLMRFIMTYTRDSLPNNFQDLQSRHLIDLDGRGVPRAARIEIERMFEETQEGRMDPDDLKRELDNWDLFEEYEPRFYDLFRRH